MNKQWIGRVYIAPWKIEIGVCVCVRLADVGETTEVESHAFKSSFMQ